MREIVIGYDHRFGRAARGDRALLESLSERLGFSVDEIPERIESGVTVSSSEIRRLLAGGDAARAAELLGRPYTIRGTVVRGDGRGRTIGVPTANVEPADARKLIPRTGVYVVRVGLDGERVGGMLNVGRRPTFETDGRLTVEVHLLGFDGDLYGRTLDVEVLARLRDERRFDGPEALVAQIREDRAEAERALQTIV
jgi:riboflavin kinase/FMN adenylyltransferase